MSIRASAGIRPASNAARRRALRSGSAMVALAAGMLAAPLVVSEAQAAGECTSNGPVGAGDPYPVSCGGGPYNNGIVYGTTQTNPASSTEFNFDSSQVTNGPSSGSNRSGVQITTGELDHDVEINIDQTTNVAPLFHGRDVTFAGSTTSNGFQANTTGNNSPLTFNVNQEAPGGNPGAGAVFTGGNLNLVPSGTSMGISLGTTGTDSAIDINLTNVTVQGGSVLAASGTAHGFGATTTGANSGIGFSLDGGTIKGGSVNALAGNADGVNLRTTGSNSDIDFDLVKGSITGGTGLSGGDGVDLSVSGAGSDIDFLSGEDTSVSATNGHGVSLAASGGGNVIGQVNGSVTSTLAPLGVGSGVGLRGIATGGNGNVTLGVGEDGEVSGTAAGVIGTTVGAGNVDIDIHGNVTQTSEQAADLSLGTIIPVGVGGVASGSGNVDVTTHAGSTVTQNGRVPLLGTEGVGVLAMNSGSGDATATANGAVNATGFGVAAVALGGGDATANVGGDINVDGAEGDTVLGLLGFEELGNGTVGALALSAGGAATVNLNGGLIEGDTPDFGLMSVVLGGGEDATVNVAADEGGATEVNANLIGVSAINLGGGDVFITETEYDDGEGNLTPNLIDSDGIGVLGFALTGNVNIESGTVDSGEDGVLGLTGGVIGATLGGNVDITTKGNVTTLGAFGVAGFAGEDVDIALRDKTITANNGIGVIGVGLGEVDIEGEDSTVHSKGIGVLAVGNSVHVDSGTVTSGEDSGVVGLALGGDADVDTHGKISADNGLFGAAAISLGGNASLTIGEDIDPPSIGGAAFGLGGDADIDILPGVTVEADDLGIVALAIGGDADIEGDPTSHVISGGAGVLGTAIGGNVYIDTGTVDANGSGLGGVGIAGLAIDGSVDIDTHGNTTALGAFVIGGFAIGGDVGIDLGGEDVSAVNGIGVIGIATGDVDIEGEDSHVVSSDTGILAVGNNVYVDTGSIDSANGSGVIGMAIAGDADVDTHGKISADNGTFGAAAIALAGNASLTIGADIDPPSIGGAAFGLGGNADLAVLDGVQVEADNLGLLALSIGGDATIAAGGSTVLVTNGAGVVATALGAGSDVVIDTRTVSATGAGALSLGIVGIAIDGNVDIETHGVTTADGAVGITALALNNASVTLSGNGVDYEDTEIQADNGIAILAIAGNNVDVVATGAEIDAGLSGIVTFSGDDTTIEAEGAVITAGDFGILATAFGDVDIEARNGNIIAGDTGIVATGNNVYVDSGAINSATGSGVIATAVAGDADVDTHGKISADNGAFGAAAIALAGNASLTIGADIDPPTIGGAAFGLGGDADIDVLAGVTVEADDLGLIAFAIGGDADIDGDPTSEVISGGVGITGTALGGNVWIDTGTVTANGTGLGGVGITGIAVDGSVDIDAHGDTTAGGLFGIDALALGGNASIDYDDNLVSAVDGAGVNAIAVGGDATIYGDANSSVLSRYVGVGALAIDGGATIDAGAVHTTGTGFEGSGIMGVAVDLGAGSGDVLINAHGAVNVENGLFGIGALATGGHATINLDAITVDAHDGAGVDAIAIGGDVDINGAASDVESAYVGVGGLALGGNVSIDSGKVTTHSGGFEGSGVVGIAVDGNATVTAHGATSILGGASGDGSFGVSGTAFGGNSVVTVGGDIDPPSVGANSFAVGGDATLNVGAYQVDAYDVGLVATAFEVSGVGGAVDINAAGSTVHALSGTGVIATAFGGGADVDTGSVTADGVGALGNGIVVNAFGGTANIATHGDTTTGDGFAGILAFATDDVNVDLLVQTVTAGSGFGVVATAVENVDIDGIGSTVQSELVGIWGLALTGNVTIDSGAVTADNASGILAAALEGSATVVAHDDTTANGMAGINVYGQTGASVTLNAGTTTANTGGYGVGATAITGNAVVSGAASTVHALDVGIFATANAGNATIDSGVVVSDTDSGVLATATGGNATIVTHGKITADSGQYGAFAFATGGNATVTVNAAIDPPVIGAASSVIGTGNATVTNNSAIEAIDVGIMLLSNGTGTVTATNNGTVGVGTFPRPGTGILTNKTGVGATTITNAATGEVFSLYSAIDATASDPGAGVADITIGNAGLLVGSGAAGLSTIEATADGSIALSNSGAGVITTSQATPETGNALDLSAGGTVGITNSWFIHGSMRVDAAGTDGDGVSILFDNLDASAWYYAANNSFVGAGDIVLNNDNSVYAFGTTVSTFSSTAGDVLITNDDEWFTDGDHDFDFVTPGVGAVSTFTNNAWVRVDGTADFIGLGTFANNALIDTTDDAHDDFTYIEGNYVAGANAELAFDAELELNGLADVITIDGDVSGTTLVTVNDIVPNVPGAYVPVEDGILFAKVGGAVSEATPDFTTDGGIDKGLYVFDAYLRPVPENADGYEEWVLASQPDREAFEVASVPYIEQNISVVLTDTWLDRTADLRSAFSNEGNVTPGAWMRAFGGGVSRDISNTTPVPGGGTVTYEDDIDQDYHGFMVGFDVGSDGQSEDGDNQAWLLGLLGGYTKSDADFSDSGTDMGFEHWSLGGYITRLDGQFFADLAVRFDFGSLDYSVEDGVFSDSFDTDYTSLNGVLDIGYRLKLGSAAFFEPKASVAYVRTKFDDTELLGSIVSLDDAESLRGRLGGRLGATLGSGGSSIIEPYIEGSVWREFEGEYGVTLESGGNTVHLGYNAEDTIGEVASGISFANSESGWSFFVRGSYQFGGDQNFSAWEGNAGLRKTFGRTSRPAPENLPGPLPAPPPPPPPPPPAPPVVRCNSGPYIVFFDWDKSDITPEAATILDSAVVAYGNCSRVPIMLAGYTDRSGSEAYNMGLAARRNTSVRGYLTMKGLSDSAISSEAFGEANPRVPTADGVRELQNRRVEITYGPGSGN